MATKFRARRIRLDRGGYDRSGHYWGTGGEPLFEVYEVGQDEGYHRRPGMNVNFGGGNAVIRAGSNKEAIRKVRLKELREQRDRRRGETRRRYRSYLGRGGASFFEPGKYAGDYYTVAELRAMASRRLKSTRSRRSR